MSRSVLLPPSRRAPVRVRRAPMRRGRVAGGHAIVLVAMALVLTQAGVGMAVNLYATIPAHHPGADPSSYLPGSFHSVVWAIAHGTPALAAHAALGLSLVVITLAVPVHLLRVARPAATFCSLLAAGLVIGAGFNGASFLDYTHNVSSLLMALLALTAVGLYGIALALMG